MLSLGLVVHINYCADVKIVRKPHRGVSFSTFQATPCTLCYWLRKLIITRIINLVETRGSTVMWKSSLQIFSINCHEKKKEMRFFSQKVSNRLRHGASMQRKTEANSIELNVLFKMFWNGLFASLNKPPAVALQATRFCSLVITKLLPVVSVIFVWSAHKSVFLFSFLVWI